MNALLTLLASHPLLCFLYTISIGTSYIPLFQTCFIHATISTVLLCIAGKFSR